MPPQMIERATRHRLEGDWRRACAAAYVTVSPYVADVPELEHLIPDLLRWHIPRDPQTGLFKPHRSYALAPLHDQQVLVARTPGPGGDQQLVLDGGDRGHAGNTFLLLRDHWDARCTAQLLTRCGGPDFLTSKPLLLDESGRHAEAWAAAGFDLEVLLFDKRWGRAGDFPDPEWRRQAVEQSLAWLRPAFAFLPEAVERVANDTGLVRIELRARRLVFEAGSRRVRLLWNTPNPDAEREEFGVELWRVPSMPLALARRPEALTALLRGDLSPDDLHPVMFATLFPGRSGPHPRPLEPLPSAVVVHCGGAVHTVRMEDGRITIPHTPEEIARERALIALGGAPVGCLAALDGWSDPRVPLPRPMRRVRDEFVLRAAHGDVWSVDAALRNGLDDSVRSADGFDLESMLAWTQPPGALHRAMSRRP
ncbi:hypothetical protein ACQP00_01605 [Dactylosporangium sp. CS-047395]|uniref:hypothetical protein n=1 Tax=Dactylosporangium sp. CS-047395 TaxID=3239936 RepID=UPI003D8B353E